VALDDPVKIYAAASNVQAQLVCRLLEKAGIEAFADEDLSPAGLWLGGTIPGMFDAGVYVSREDAEQAVGVIRKWEQVEAARAAPSDEEVEATCEECGQTSSFPVAQDGTVQDCPHCGAYMDVGEEDLPDDWEEEGEDEGEP
jgi:rubrerythrin